MRIRQAPPGAAWNEAHRRATPFGFAGFFLGGLISVFSDGGLGIAEPFLAGLCGAVGLFVGSLALIVGVYHRRVTLAVIVAGLMLILPTAVVGRVEPWTGPGRLAVGMSIATAFALYLTLHECHRRLSGMTFDEYLRQLADDEQETLTPVVRQPYVWLLAAFGILAVLGLMSIR